MMTAAMIGSNKGQDCHGFGGMQDRIDSIFATQTISTLKYSEVNDSE